MHQPSAERLRAEPETQDGSSPETSGSVLSSAHNEVDELAYAAAELSGADAAAVCFPEGRSVWFRGWSGLRQPSAPLTGSLAELVMRMGVEVDVPDREAHPQLSADVLLHGPGGFRAAVGFPLRSADGSVIGALVLLAAAPLQLSERVRGVVRVLGHQAVAQVERRAYRLPIIRQDGTVRHLEGWAEAEIDPLSGRCIRARGTVQDVTDDMAREAALAQSEQRLRLTIENSPIGVALIGLDGTWLQANEAMARMVGYSSEALMKLRFQDITHPDDLDADLALLAELTAGERRFYQLDKRYLHANGQVVWASLTASVVRDAAGRPLHYVSLVEDITERRKATAELQAERDLLAALLGALHDGYAYLEHGRIVAVNDVFCEMTGMAREQLMDRPTPFSIFAADPSGRGGTFGKLVNDKSGYVELTVERPDGSRLDVGIQLRPVRRPDGRVRGYVALMRDITDRKQHEQRLRHRADHDGLTGLLNRAAFHVRLTERVAAAHASGAALSLALIDLDRFKLVNDGHGHPAGDAVLAEFADRLRGNARGDDVIGRLGGEEFGWLMSDTGREEAVGALSRTLDAVRRHPFPHGEQLTFSAGLVQLRTYSVGSPSEMVASETSDSLVQRADQLLYAAKAGGRDQVVTSPAGPASPAPRVSSAEPAG